MIYNKSWISRKCLKNNEKEGKKESKKIKNRKKKFAFSFNLQNLLS